MTVTMYKSKSNVATDDIKKPSIPPAQEPKSPCCDGPEKKVQLQRPIQPTAAMGLGLGGNNPGMIGPMDKPQTLDQIPTPMPKQSLMLSERDLLKMLEEK